MSMPSFAYRDTGRRRNGVAHRYIGNHRPCGIGMRRMPDAEVPARRRLDRPGPDWMPKQAHMADLQAECAAKNLVAELSGQTADASFKIELMCIVDSCDKGLFVSRTEHKNTVLPANKAMHWAKRGFEWWYLRQYR